MFLLLSPSTSSSENILPEETTKQINAFTKYWQSINWESVTSLIISKTISFIFMTLLVIIIKKIGDRLIKRSLNPVRLTESDGENRGKTLYSLINNIFHYLLLFFYIYYLLNLIGVPVGSLVAGAGIAGIAIGLGAQGFINDLITGFFIIFEKQIEVGDSVIIGASEGTVQSVGLRTTQVKSSDGVVHFIPNRTILVISNQSKANRKAIINLRVNPNSDIEHIKQIIQQVNERLVPNFPEITQDPEIVGIVDLGDGHLALKIVIGTTNGAQSSVQSSFLEEYIATLSLENIDLPFTSTVFSQTKK